MKVLPHSQIIPAFSRTETERQNIGFGLCKFISAYRKNAEIILCTYFNNCICLLRQVSYE